PEAQRGRCRVSSTVCWNVGRLIQGNAGMSIPETTVDRVSSKQLASTRCSLAHAGSWPYRSCLVTLSAAASDRLSAPRQRLREPFPQYARDQGPRGLGPNRSRRSLLT